MSALKIFRSCPRFYEKSPEKHFFFTLYSPQKVAQYFSAFRTCLRFLWGKESRLMAQRFQNCIFVLVYFEA